MRWADVAEQLGGRPGDAEADHRAEQRVLVARDDAARRRAWPSAGRRSGRRRAARAARSATANGLARAPRDAGRPRTPLEPRLVAQHRRRRLEDDRVAQRARRPRPPRRPSRTGRCARRRCRRPPSSSRASSRVEPRAPRGPRRAPARRAPRRAVAVDARPGATGSPRSRWPPLGVARGGGERAHGVLGHGVGGDDAPVRPSSVVPEQPSTTPRMPRNVATQGFS